MYPVLLALSIQFTFLHMYACRLFNLLCLFFPKYLYFFLHASCGRALSRSLTRVEVMLKRERALRHRRRVEAEMMGVLPATSTATWRICSSLPGSL